VKTEIDRVHIHQYVYCPHLRSLIILSDTGRFIYLSAP
jgi:hypothetical protein